MNIMDMTSLLRIVSDRIRLRILAALSVETLSVSELVSSLEISQPRTSHHLALLLKAGLVTVQRDGVRGFYSLNSDGIHAGLIDHIIASTAEDAELMNDRARVVMQISRRREERLTFFASLADAWPKTVERWFDMEQYRSLVIDNIPAKRITADLGCGPGWLLDELAEKATCIIGVDHSPDVLSLARQHAAMKNLSNCDFRLGELEHLPIRDKEVECILFGLVLHYVVDPQIVFNEASRIAGDNATLVIVEPYRHGNESAREELGEIWMGFEVPELTDHLVRAGFASIRSRTINQQDPLLSLLVITAEKPHVT